LGKKKMTFDLDQFIGEIKNFFEKSFKVKLGSLYLKTVMDDSFIILSPFYALTDNFVIKVDDLKKIEEFFKGVLKMSGVKATKVIREIKKQTKNYDMITIGFYYYMGFRVTLHFTFFRDNGETLLALNYVEVYKEGEKTKEVIMAKVKNDMEELERLLKDKEYE
jgi:hypothetical protein